MESTPQPTSDPWADDYEIVEAGPYRFTMTRGPKLALLQDRLRAHGGDPDSGRLQHSPFLDFLLTPELAPDAPVYTSPDRAQVWPATTKRRRMEPCHCHENSIRLYRRDPEHYRVGHGYALSDGMWCLHSWVVRIDRPRATAVIETTADRERYYGIVLDEDGIELFAGGFGLASITEDALNARLYSKLAAKEYANPSSSDH